MTTAIFDAEEQRTEALNAANKVRFRNKQFRAELARLDRIEGLYAAAEMLRDTGNEETARMKLAYLLLSIDHVGASAVRNTLGRAGVMQGRATYRIGDLTDGERLRLAGALIARAKWGKAAA